MSQKAANFTFLPHLRNDLSVKTGFWVRFVPNPGSRRKRSLSRGPLHSWAFLFLKNMHFSPSPEHATFLMDQKSPLPKKGSLSPPFCHEDVHARKPVRNLHSIVKGKHKYRPLLSECQQARLRIPSEGILKARSNLIHYCECHLFQCLSFSPILSHVSGTTRSLALICASLTFEVTLALAILHYLYMPVHILGSFSFLKDTPPTHTFIYTVKLYANSCCFIGNTL